MFIAALFTVAQIRKQPKSPSADEQIKKMWFIINGMLPSHKKNEMPFATSMEIEINIVSKVSQKEDKYHTTSLMCRL